MKIKRIIAITVVISMLLLTSCSNGPDCSDVEENSINQTVSLESKSIELAQEIDMLASNNVYIDSFSLDNEINSIIDTIASQDYSNPTDIYKFSKIDSSFSTIVEYIGIEVPEFGNDRLTALHKEKLIHSLPSKINSMSGADMILSTSLITTEDIFLYSDLTETEAYLLLYDGDYNIVVIFTPQGEGIVKASANIVTHEMLSQIQSDGDIDSKLKLGISFVGIYLEKINE